VIQLDAEPPEAQQIFIRSFPMFFYLRFGRQLWTKDHVVKDWSCVTFLILLDRTSHGCWAEYRCPYQLTVVISRLGNPEKGQGHYVVPQAIPPMNSSDIVGDDVEDSAALQENFPDPHKLSLSCSTWQTTGQMIQ
jgi:hypothetical protein